MEAKILKRLRDTHSKQQTAISEINKIFSVNMDDRIAEAKDMIPQNLSYHSPQLPEDQVEEESGEGEEAGESSSDDED